MWFNSKQRAEPYQPLTSLDSPRDRVSTSVARWQVLHGCRQLVSWDVRLSPATSATPTVYCHHSVGHFYWTAVNKTEEGGDDVKSSCPLCLGLHTYYNGNDRGQRHSDMKRIPKRYLSSDWRLQLASMKPELLVMAGQHTAVNTFSGLVHTARHTMRVCNTRSW